MSELEHLEAFCVCSEDTVKARELFRWSEHQLIFKQYCCLLVLAYFAAFLNASFPSSTSFIKNELRGDNLVHLRAEVTIYNIEHGLTERYLLATLMFCS